MNINTQDDERQEKKWVERFSKCMFCFPGQAHVTGVILQYLVTMTDTQKIAVLKKRNGTFEHLVKFEFLRKGYISL